MNSNTLIDKIKKNKYLSEFLTGKSIGQFKRYLITGFTTFAVEYTLFRVFKDLVFTNQDYNYLVANTVVYIGIFWFNFLVNRIWSFKSKDNLGRQLKLYGLLFCFNLLVTNLLLYVLVKYVGIDSNISKILVMGAVVAWNFVLYKKVIYK